MHCLALNDPKNTWSFCPNIAPAILFTILFALTTLAHTAQSIIYRKLYSIVIIMGSLWELVAFIFRSMNIYDMTSSAYYSVWFILILVAPLWINAYIYMVVGRMVWNFSPRGKIWVIPAHRFGLCFVVLDILAFLAQAAGAVMATNTGATGAEIMRGIHVYMGGIGFQQLFIFAFAALAASFHRELRATGAQPKVWRLLYAVYAVLTLITIRIIFRLFEYINSYTGYAPNHEAFLYIFDALPMVTALFILNLIHPASVMSGREADLPSRKERRRRSAQGHQFEKLAVVDESGDASLLSV